MQMRNLPVRYMQTGGASDTQDPYVSGITRIEGGLDPLTRQLMFGLSGKGGFIPGAMRAAERTFFDEEGRARVVPQEIAGLTPDQLQAMELAREATGLQDPYLADAVAAYRQAPSLLGTGLEAARGRQLESLGAIESGVSGLGTRLSDIEALQRGATGEFGGRLGDIAGQQRGAAGAFGTRLGDVEALQRGAVGEFGTQLGGIAGRGIGATDVFGGQLGESEALMRGTTGAYDPTLTGQFYDPYEQQVVQQTIEDVMEAGDIQDMQARARDIQTGGESAFGSRARLGASERREALGRGLGQALGSLRSQGFQRAQQTGLGEFARQKAAERTAASGLSGLAGQRLGSQQNLTGILSGLAGQQFGAKTGLATGLGSLAGQRFGAQQTQAGALSNLGNLEAQIGQQRAQAQMGLGANLQGLGAQAQQAGAFGVNQLMGMGNVQQQQAQQQLEAQRANLLQAQQAPLAQYQSLLPFVQSVPAGQQQTTTQYAPSPSPLQAGLGVGLSTLGALGQFFGQGYKAGGP